MLTNEEREIAIKAMQASKAWPAVFNSGSARALLDAALSAVEQHRVAQSRRRRVAELARWHEQ